MPEQDRCATASAPPRELNRLRNASWTGSVSVVLALAVVAAFLSNNTAPTPNTPCPDAAPLSNNDRSAASASTTRQLLEQLGHHGEADLYRRARPLTGLISRKELRQRATSSVYDEPEPAPPSVPMTSTTTAAVTATTPSVYDEPATESGSVSAPVKTASVYDEPERETGPAVAPVVHTAGATTTAMQSVYDTAATSVYDESPPAADATAAAATATATTTASTTTTSTTSHADEKEDDDHDFVAPQKSITTTTVTTTTTTTTTSTSGEPNSHSNAYSTPSFVSAESNRAHYGTPQKRKQVFAQEHPPFWPPTSSTLWGYFLAILSLVIAAGGGIGGGGLLVPIYIIVMGFSPKHAIPLSNVTVFGGAIANMYLNLSKRHPLVDRPLVDWDLILVMEPLTIAGALMGAFLNKVLPEVVLTLALVALLGFTAYTTFQKAASLRRKETAALAQAGFKPDGSKQSELTQLIQNQDDDNDDDDDEEVGGPDSDSVPDNGAAAGGGDGANDAAKANPTLQEILEYERHTPIVNLQILGALFAVVLAVNLLKGGGAFRSPIGITCGSSMFWVANAFMLVWIVAITALVRQYLVKRNKVKLECGYPFVEGDIQWDDRATLVYPVVCCLAGFCAGMFGIGGGIVKGPLMLAMGVHPAVSSASSACMILFTSFTATTSYVVFGLLLEDYAFACLVLGFVATFAGQVGINAIMARTGNRYSYIAYSVAIVVLLSACLMTIQSLLSMAAGEKHHSGGVCGSGD